MSVINSTTKGKNDRIELAATEKAKVCTSVRSRYLRVEIAKPERARRGLRGGAGAPSVAGGAATVVGSDTGVFPNLIKGLRLVPTSPGNEGPGSKRAVSYTLLKLQIWPRGIFWPKT